MAHSGSTAVLEERNHELAESLSVTRQKVAEISSSLRQLTEYLEHRSNQPAYASALGYTSPFPVNITAQAPKSVNRGHTDGISSPGLLSNLFVDQDNTQPEGTANQTGAQSMSLSPGSDQIGASPNDVSGVHNFFHDYAVGTPSDACLEILYHEGIVRQIRIQELAEDPANCQSLDSLVARLLHSLGSSGKWERLAFFCHIVSGWDKLGPITRWRIEPTAKNYMVLPMCWRPSNLQLTRHHWPIIDWIPFPKIRDELILHANMYDLNKVCVELNTSFCLEMTIADAYPENTHENGDGTSFGSLQPDWRRQNVVYVLLQEYVDHCTKDKTNGTAREQVNENILTRLLLAFRQQENPFKLHSKFFEQFPNLRSDLYMVHGDRISIFDG